MTKNVKVRYLDIAARICGFHMDIENLDLLISLYEGVLEKEGEFSLKDAAKIKTEVKDRQRKRNADSTLSKFSDKAAESPESTE
jgi:hypothetical protein